MIEVLCEFATAMMMLGFLGLMLCRLRVTYCFQIISSSSHALFLVILLGIHANNIAILCFGFWMDIVKC
jgi:hypothetical protein